MLAYKGDSREWKETSKWILENFVLGLLVLIRSTLAATEESPGVTRKGLNVTGQSMDDQSMASKKYTI